MSALRERAAGADPQAFFLDAPNDRAPARVEAVDCVVAQCLLVTRQRRLGGTGGGRAHGGPILCNTKVLAGRRAQKARIITKNATMR